MSAFLASAWGRRLLALAAGAAAALAHPPFGVLPGLLGYALMMHLVDQARGVRSAFLRGWLAGSAYFAIGTWWVAEAFFVDIRQAWMAPFAALFMATGLALFWGGAAALYRWAAPKGVSRVLVFAAALSVFEWLRGHVLTGFPWNLPGETWAAGSAPSQSAALVGAYGLTFVTIALGAAFATFREGRRGGVAALATVALLAGLYGYGSWRLSDAPEGPGPLVRIVQADVGQSAKYDPAAFKAIVDKYVTLTARPDGPKGPPAIVVWPEGAIPAAANDYLAEGTWTYAAIVGALKPEQVLLLGAYRVDGPQEAPLYYNTLLAMRARAGRLEPLATYDKHRLVPFGEYMPLDGLMSRLGVKQLVHVGDGFTPGPPPGLMVLKGAPALQPLVCYESLFPGFTRRAVKAAGRRPDYILNVSNDAWFGTLSGPQQHLNLASYRAIEEGLPMVRSTPTGVSAMIDASGRVVDGARLELGQAGVIDAFLPPKREATVYGRFGDLPFWLVIFFCGALAVRPRLLIELKEHHYAR